MDSEDAGKHAKFSLGLNITDLRPGTTNQYESVISEDEKRTFQDQVENLINEGISEGHRFALSSDLWRHAAPVGPCDVLVTLAPGEQSQHVALWLIEQIKRFEPNLHIAARFHQLTGVYGLYFTAKYVSLLKGAELLHLKKPVKSRFGGGLKEFCFEEAQCYAGVEQKATFLSGHERALVVKQMLEMIRAPDGGLSLKLQDQTIFTVRQGRAIMSALLSEGLVTQMLPLHEHERLKQLHHRWVLALLDEQPIDHIKYYFGSQIAMYFAWLGHLTTALWFPAIVGLFMFWFGGTSFDNALNEDQPVAGSDNQLFSDICFVAFALFNCVWSTSYLELWKRKQAELAFKWGTFAMDHDQYLEEPRAGFKGDYLAANPVTGRMEPFYPMWKHRLIRYGITYPVTCVCVMFMFIAMFCVFRLQDYTNYLVGQSWLFGWLTFVPMIIYAVLIIAGDALYRQLALFLNDLENYRTEDEYENFLITKIVAFQCVSAFGSLFYVAFYLKDMKRLQETLATLLITRQVFQNVMEAGVPFFIGKFKFTRLTYQMTRKLSQSSLERHVSAVRKKRQSESVTADASPVSPFLKTLDDSDSASGSELRHRKPGEAKENASPTEHAERKWSLTRSPRLPVPEFQPSSDQGMELTQAELESVMKTYPRPLDDYLEIFIQFGYVLLFSPAFPLAGLCALANNLLEIRVDSFKLCNAVQRPFGRIVSSIGAWQQAMELMGVAGVLVNCALIGQSGLVQRMWPDLSFGGQILLVVVLEHLVLAAKTMLDLAIPDVPEWIRIEIAKVEHWRREAFNRESKLLTGDKRNVGNGMGMRERVATEEATSAGARKKRSITPQCRPISQFVKRYTDGNL